MRRTALLAVGLAVLGGRPASAYFPDTVARAVVRSWAQPSALVGLALIGEYGLPDDVMFGRVTWLGKGPWKRTVVVDRAQVYRAPADLGIVEQTIDYPVPAGRVAELVAFRGSLVVDRERGELTSLGESEEANFLALNLADDIVQGRKTPEEARAAYARAQAEEAAGDPPAALTRLLFRPRPGG